MAHKVVCWIRLVGLICLATSGLECFIQSEGTPSTSIICASGQHNISCDSNTAIAITEMAYGYKGDSSGCSKATGRCCTYDNTTDCLESSTTDTTLMELLSGNSDGIASIGDAIATTNCTSGYMGISTFNMMSYQCIPVRRIFDMCEPGTYRSGNGLPIYIWNRDYGSGTSILDTDSSCSVSIEVLSLSKNIVLYTLHMQLYDILANCQQSITVSDGTNIVKTFGCNHAPFNQIQSETIYGNYFILNLTNTAHSLGGKFWIGLQGPSESVPMLLSLPAIHRIDCGTLNKPINGNVFTTDTFYGSTASYVCDPGYGSTSGNIFRTCQENKTWSGHAVVCLYDPENGFVSFTGTSPGHTATYFCDTFYVMDVGNIHRTCIDKIGWTGTALSCIYECGALTDPPNGSVSYIASTAGSQAMYACTGDLVPNGPVIRTCVAEKGWDGSEPTCVPKTSDCDDLSDPANGSVSFSVNITGRHATYICNSGFVLIGTQTRICVSGSFWSGSEPTCSYETSNNIVPTAECFDIKTVILVVSFVEALIVVIGVVVYKCRLIGKIRNCIVTVTASENTHSPGKDILFSTARTHQFELSLTTGSPFNNLVQNSETSEQVNSEKQNHITEETPGTSLYTALYMYSNPSESIYSELQANIGGSGRAIKN